MSSPLVHAADANDTTAHDPQTDEQLVARAAAGDRRAFDVLVLKYQSRLVALTYRFTKDRGDALDVAQEAFVRAWQGLPNFRGDSKFYTWLYRIAVNTSKNFLSRKKRRPVEYVDMQDGERVDVQRSLGSSDTPEGIMVSEQIKQVILQAMDALPEELATALTLREVEGMSYEDIADTMGCPIGTVRSRIFRAREAVAKRVKPLM